MKGSVGVSCRMEYIFSGTPIYNKAYMKTTDSIFSFDNSNIVQFRLKVIEFHNKYGTKATIDAFSVKQRTIFYWKKLLKDGKGRLSSLIPKKKTPKRKREMIVDKRIIEYIKNLRETYGAIGKEKIKIILDKFCLDNNLKPISFSTIGKVIKRYNLYLKPKRIYHNPHYNYKNLYKRYKTKIKHSSKINKSGYIEIDTIVKFVCGVKLYIINALDVYNKFSFSYGYTKLNSFNALDFLKKLELVYPIKNSIKVIQTDNGLEFLGEFDSYLKKKNIKHVFIYPRCSKINAYIERQNRTLQDEFVYANEDLILTSVDEFNKKLIDYLLWYNCQRPHKSLNNLSPIDFIIKHYLKNYPKECKMYVTYTYGCNTNYLDL